MTDIKTHDALLAHTAQIVSGHLSANQVAVDDIPALIKKIYQTLASLNGADSDAAEKPQPAVPIKKSITQDYVICLEDGKKLKMLKRYLKTAYGMTPDQYRERWGLGPDYPMVAPSYAKRRSSLAKEIGLGTTGRGK
jgi:predicted transcriptional regulator